MRSCQAQRQRPQQEMTFDLRHAHCICVIHLLVSPQAKAMQQGGDAKPGAAANSNAEALPGVNFGPKYEAHVSEMQNKLDEASKR